MNEDIFKSSLNDDNCEGTQTYDITKLLYVAFFGGVIPTIALGTVNARWLRIDKRIVNLLIGFGVIILLAKVVIFGIISDNYSRFNASNLKWGYRIASVVLYLAYYAVMKRNFNQHIFLEGETKPLLKAAILWIIIGMVAEFFLLTIGGLII